ncbi:hypothetical protein ID866_4907 [Astraeus odoratus]|nr:hypothetical protein ID866_4907 [Astraeus odoratus]
MRNSSYLRSSVLIFGGASTRALLSSTLIAQVESLLENGRLVDAEALLDGAAVGSTDPDILRYLHQCIAFKYLGQTSFRDATQHFVKGAIDPRILISYFEELRPALYGEDFSLVPASPQEQAGDDYVDVEIYAGVRQYMPRETNVDDIIAANLVRNYSPHLRSKAHLDDAMNVPDDTVPSSSVSGTRTHPATIAMREGLREQGREMLAGILNAFVAGGGETWSSGVARVCISFPG